MAAPVARRRTRARADRSRSARPAPTGGYPWGWIAAVVLAMLSGFLLARSAMADWWVLAVVMLAVVAAAAGYESGRRSGERK